MWKYVEPARVLGVRSTLYSIPTVKAPLPLSPTLLIRYSTEYRVGIPTRSAPLARQFRSFSRSFLPFIHCIGAIRDLIYLPSFFFFFFYLVNSHSPFSLKMTSISQEWIPSLGEWPVDPQQDTPISQDRIWVDGCFDFTHHGEILTLVYLGHVVRS